MCENRIFFTSWSFDYEEQTAFIQAFFGINIPFDPGGMCDAGSVWEGFRIKYDGVQILMFFFSREHNYLFVYSKCFLWCTEKEI